VLKWVFERVSGSGVARKTAIGYLPPTDAIDTTALNVNEADLSAILDVDVAGWFNAVPQIKEHYAKFGSHIPSELTGALAALERELAN
jgi:phosphoenolpyruvate carboxykinase (GTP)